jgi:beta-phosphoglucomutase
MRDLGVIFDMDGVLVDSYRAHLQSWQEAAGAFGVQMSPQDFARTFGRTSREIIRQLWPATFSDDQVNRFDLAKEARYREILESDFPEMPGAAQLIRTLHDAGFKLAVGSSAPPENVAVLLRRLHNGNLFTATVSGAEVEHGKPDPEIFLLAASKLALSPERCAVIEDAPTGLQAAKRAGMVAIALPGTAPIDVLRQHADFVTESLASLTPQMIRTLVP